MIKKKKIKVAISGALGRMGKILTKEIKKNKNIQLIHALINHHNNKNNHIQNIKHYSNKESFFITSENIKENKNILQFDTLIDFSTPDTTLKLIKYCVKNKKKMIIGTTGFDDTQMQKIKNASCKIPILFSPNFSIGINILQKILKYISCVFDHNCDIEIIESHHRKKMDAPSGTALQLGKIICKKMKWDFNKSAIFSRQGNIGIRKRKKIGFSTIREGNTIGEHTVLFSNKYEKISIIHKSSHRSTFAKGALKAVIWINNKKKGFYKMSDVLRDVLIK